MAEEKEMKIKKTYTVEITVSGWATSEKYFDKEVRERFRDLCIDTVSVGIHGSASVKTGKVKVIGVK